MADVSTAGTPVTLESVKAKFGQWRSTRQGIERIPQALWDDVQALLEHCSMSQVSQALRVSYKQIRGREPRQRALPDKKPMAPDAHRFVEAFLPTVQGNQDSARAKYCDLEIKTANGATVAIKNVHENAAMQWAQSLVRS